MSLQLKVFYDVGSSEGWGADARKVLRHSFVIQQLFPLHTHYFDGHAEDAVVLDVGRCEGTRSSEPNPRRINLRSPEKSTSQLRREIGKNLKVASHEAVSLSISSPQCDAVAVVLDQKPLHLLSDLLRDLFFVWKEFLFCNGKVLVCPPHID